jgi:site-specific recombinase XerD
MLEELERRNYSQSTPRAYLMTIKDFARYFRQSPDKLGPEHIRQYQAYLFRERKLAANSVNQRVGALRFFFIKTLKRTWSVDETPYPKKVIRLLRLLEALREHWRSLKRKPNKWLFPGNRWHTADYPITTKVAWLACREAALRAGLGDDIHPHTLRHYAASRTMPRVVRQPRYMGV